jgi:hypothetical protein
MGRIFNRGPASVKRMAAAAFKGLAKLPAAESRNKVLCISAHSLRQLAYPTTQGGNIGHQLPQDA